MYINLQYPYISGDPDNFKIANPIIIVIHIIFKRRRITDCAAFQFISSSEPRVAIILEQRRKRKLVDLQARDLKLREWLDRQRR